MKLDENVCRGTLIIHKAERLVVIGPGVHYDKTAGKYGGQHTQQRLGWRVMTTAQFEEGCISVDSVRTIDKFEEVEMFFPGVAFELPEYIK